MARDICNYEPCYCLTGKMFAHCCCFFFFAFSVSTFTTVTTYYTLLHQLQLLQHTIDVNNAKQITEISCVWKRLFLFTCRTIIGLVGEWEPNPKRCKSIQAFLLLNRSILSSSHFTTRRFSCEKSKWNTNQRRKSRVTYTPHHFNGPPAPACLRSLSGVSQSSQIIYIEKRQWCVILRCYMPIIHSSLIRLA